MTSAEDPEGVQDLLRRVQGLELVARQNAAGWLMGDYLTAIRGQGMVFHESRKYVVGEPARHIDWNVTARLGEPYVKVHLEERRRDVVVALDVSPSMHTGFGERSKLELAVELAATLGVAAQQAGDRLGHLLFADRLLHESRPRAGKAQLFRFLRAVLDHCQPWQRPVEVSDPRAVFHALETLGRGRCVVFLISDFIDHDIPDDLKYARARHDISLLHIYDPLEHAKGPVVLRGRALEGSGQGPVALGEGESLAAMGAFLRRHAAPYGVAVESFSTEEPLIGALAKFFHRKRRQLALGS